MRRVLVVWLTLLALGSAAPRGAFAAEKREMEAREYFAAGRYQEALDLFAKLYAEKLHPVYLRNIGRCYQNLGQPEHAITSFRDYLRKTKRISAEERAEIDGYIHEMEELEKKQAAAPPPKEPVEPLASTKPEPVRTAPPPLAPPPAVEPSAGTAQPDLVVSRPEEPGTSSTDAPVYTRWWFWTVVGVVAVGAAVGVAAAAGAFKGNAKDAPCSVGTDCVP